MTNGNSDHPTVFQVFWITFIVIVAAVVGIWMLQDISTAIHAMCVHSGATGC